MTPEQLRQYLSFYQDLGVKNLYRRALGAQPAPSEKAAPVPALIELPSLAPAGDTLERTLEHIGSDRMLLFSTDYPHWQFDGDAVLPPGLAEPAVQRMLIDNPLETYPRLQDGTGIGDNRATHKEAVR